ncbi:hypothetical protein [Paraliomyxa miuraensis]|uniref:hypothetical protein n=1 Tax=Paraliomyxa miuraensis TaxID=376150 RepID=UPI002259ABC0|nr:hypothetical protein [Paraliomyxa miuraensis]MCX4239247.1 hypothetical protein [Paraliomyxa miuraensis]
MYATIREELIADGMLRGKAEGKAEMLAEMLEQLLDSRELGLTDALRERVAGCKDESLFRRWFQRAITATNLTEVFDD